MTACLPRCLRFLGAALVAVSLAACGGGGGGGDDGSGPPAGGGGGGGGGSIAADVIVQLRPGVDVSSVAAAFGLGVADQFGRRPIWRLRAAAGSDIAALVVALQGDARVLFAEPNVESETPEGRRRTVWAAGGDAGSFGTQWAPAAMRLADAQALSTGSGIRVAVLDTGIDLAHPVLAPRLARNGAGALLGRDFVDDDADPAEGGGVGDAGWGHGTHVAGLVVLAAPGATLMPARVLDAQGRGNAWVLSEALLWAVDPDGNPATDDGAHVINLSLGTTQPTRLLRTATTLADCDFDDDDDAFADPGFDDDKARCAAKHAAVVMAAAGNAGNDTELQYPAAEQVPGSMAVTASSASGTLAPFANRGSWVEIAAPGDAVISTFPGGGYATWSGTSMASPLAAGTAALVLATFGNPRDVVPVDITSRLLARSVNLCGTALRQVDALGAVSGIDPPARACP